MQSTSCECRDGWIISWNPNCQQKYQQPHIRRWQHSNGRKQIGTKEALDQGEGGEKKTGLKLNIQNAMIMASHYSMANRREKCGSSDRFCFLGFQNHCRCDCSHQIKRHLLLLGRKAMTNLDSLLKSKDITVLTKVHIVKAMIFPLVMQRYESWTIRKAKCWKIGAF